MIGDVVKVYINHSMFETETLSFIKVFYPFESIECAEEEQSDYRITVKSNVMKVAFFDVDGKCLLGISRPIDGWSPDSNKEITKLVKRQLKGILYDLCHQVTGKDIPWGILTGIRPTKLAFKLFDHLGNEDLVIKSLVEDYRLSLEKAHMLMKVVRNEMPYMTEVNMKYSVYIGIPFCPSRCSYCTFTSYKADKKPEEFCQYTDVLIKELEAGSQWLNTCHSIYIGGGTPTSLTDEDFHKLIRKIRELIGNRDIEFTIEAGRPDTISIAKLKSMKEYGVNRISINPQTMSDATLTRIGRSHNSDEVIKTYKLARNMGFDHINMDIILGLPGEDISDITHTVDSLISLDPESITVHTLAFKRGSKLSDQRIKLLKESCDLIMNMLKVTYDKLTANYYHPYYLYRQKNMVGNFENVGYCKTGKESVYNIQIMEEVESIVAYGAGAISKRVMGHKIQRQDQPKDVSLYIRSIDQIIQKKNNFFMT